MDLDCHDCDAQLKKERGCTGEAKVGWDIDGVMYRRCPKTLITPISYEYIQAYNLFKHNLLPNNKGWRNESGKFLNAMMYMEAEVARVQSEQFEKKVKHKK